jgi:hypothetical protein
MANQASSICRRKRRSWTADVWAKYREALAARKAEKLQRFIESLTPEGIAASRTGKKRITLYVTHQRVNFNEFLESGVGYLYDFDRASGIVHIMLTKRNGLPAPRATIVSLPISRVGF